MSFMCLKWDLYPTFVLMLECVKYCKQISASCVTNAVPVVCILAKLTVMMKSHCNTDKQYTIPWGTKWPLGTSAIKQEAVIWTNVVPDLCRHMVLLDHQVWWYSWVICGLSMKQVNLNSQTTLDTNLGTILTTSSATSSDALTLKVKVQTHNIDFQV